jgi:hypothetical protein
MSLPKDVIADSIRNPAAPRDKTTFFASHTLTEHLLRGAAAAALLYFAFSRGSDYPVWAFGAGVLALIAMRGCPVCWTIGLIETSVQRFKALAISRPPA